MKNLIKIAALACLFISCSNDDTVTIKQQPTGYGNTTPKNLIGSYGTYRHDAEAGIFRVTSDSVFINTENHTISVQTDQYSNSQSYQNGLPCWWVIRIGSIEYIFGAPKNNAVWLKYIDYGTADWKSHNIGTYYKNYKPAEPEPAPVFN